jgi:hypothetical protein
MFPSRLAGQSERLPSCWVGEVVGLARHSHSWEAELLREGRVEGKVSEKWGDFLPESPTYALEAMV